MFTGGIALETCFTWRLSHLQDENCQQKRQVFRPVPVDIFRLTTCPHIPKLFLQAKPPQGPTNKQIQRTNRSYQ